MVLSALSDWVGGAAGAVSGLFTDLVVRLGVTGLSRAGKTVFITSLVANLLHRGRMPQLRSAATGQIQATFLQPQPDDTVARVEYERNLDALLAAIPSWPDGIKTISQLRLSFRLAPSVMISALSRPRMLHLDIVDYPGEWLLDLGLLDLTYEQWSAAALISAEKRQEAWASYTLLSAVEGPAPFDDVTASGLAVAYAGYLQQARWAGFSNLTLGRFLPLGGSVGSPVLTFAPLPIGEACKGSFQAEMKRRFEAYKSKIMKPFFRNYFAKLDRQIVLVDVLKSLSDGPDAVADLERAMGAILTEFCSGRRGFLKKVLRGKRIDRTLLAASKADHLHHRQHPALTAMVEALTQAARDKARFVGALTAAISVGALRSNVEVELSSNCRVLPGVKGLVQSGGKTVGFYPGEFSKSPASVLSPAGASGLDWDSGPFADQNFSPSLMSLVSSVGPLHIRLDKAAEFLIGDLL
jgi:predicted YcjX-like family ATPase